MGAYIDKAVKWAVGIANDSSHGYDQNKRWGPDYDCSSLLIQAWENAGVPVKTAGASYTGNMCKHFLNNGFSDVTASVNIATGAGLLKGDVLWRSGHCEMMCSDTQRVGAHISENGTIYADEPGDQTGKEINIQAYKDTGWTRVLRFMNDIDTPSDHPSVDKNDTFNSNTYLDMDEMKINAVYIAAWFLSQGWTLNAIAGMLGNIEEESTMNPGLWQSREEGNTSGGFGLTQWTPATKLIEWASENGKNYKDIDVQMERIIWELENGVQYYARDDYPEPSTFRKFSQSTESADFLARAFLYNYERPKNPKPDERGPQGTFWYGYLYPIFNGGGGGLPPIDPVIPAARKKGLSLILMYMASRW